MRVRWLPAAAVAAAVATLLAGCGDRTPGPPIEPEPGETDGTQAGLALTEVATGLTHPLAAMPHPASGDLLVVEQDGRVLRVAGDGSDEAEVWLDIASRVGAGGAEQGLLGLAFHPDFAANGVLVVSYTDLAGDSVLERIVLADANATPGKAQGEAILTVDQPFSNHNGGHVLWGPDGHLYYGLGDGGSANDPMFNGQNGANLLGSLLRIDVGPSGPYTVPADNPFVGRQDFRPETWAYGLRNPWRFHFDAETGDLWIGDVGQGSWEEVDFQPAGSGGGENYGWNLFEGDHPTGTSAQVAAAGFTFPVAEYGHGTGHCSITMGPVARDPRIAASPAFGKALLADYCSGQAWTATPDGDLEELLATGANVSSFGLGAAGEVYVVDHGGAEGTGRVLRLDPAP